MLRPGTRGGVGRAAPRPSWRVAAPPHPHPRPGPPGCRAGASAAAGGATCGWRTWWPTSSGTPGGQSTRRGAQTSNRHSSDRAELGTDGASQLDEQLDRICDGDAACTPTSMGPQGERVAVRGDLRGARRPRRAGGRDAQHLARATGFGSRIRGGVPRVAPAPPPPGAREGIGNKTKQIGVEGEWRLRPCCKCGVDQGEG